jgi:hypothetical protein
VSFSLLWVITPNDRLEAVIELPFGVGAEKPGDGTSAWYTLPALS